MKKIPVYVANLKQRIDRKQSILAQFADKKEFDLHIIQAIELKNAPVALWKTFYNIVRNEREKNSNFFIFCEDDHIFTAHYNMANFLDIIEMADYFNAEILSGGMSEVKNPVLVCDNLFWVSRFTGMQFTVIYARFYDSILASKSDTGYVTDIHLSFLAKNKFVIYPYISIQKEFGYSDATYSNNEVGKITRFFDSTQVLLEKLYKCNKYFSQVQQDVIEAVCRTEIQEICIPTYIINLRERTDRLYHILKQFNERKEFDLHVIEAIKEENGALGLWKSICLSIRKAKENEDDCVLICEDDHFFTEYYNRDTFLRQIMISGILGAQLLSGGIGGFGNLVPLHNGLYWVDRFWCTQFIVIYKKAYDIILNTDFGIRDVADDKLSAILTNKIVIAPFISEQTDFGYSDVTDTNNHNSNIIRHFDNSRNMFMHYKYAEKIFSDGYLPYQDNPITAYLKNIGIHALQLGCGYNLIEGWLNTDVEPTYGAFFLDATQKISLPDCCMDYIFIEHLLEFLTPNQMLGVLNESYRVLKKSGVLRITLFSHENIHKLFTQTDNLDIFKRYIQWSLSNSEINQMKINDKHLKLSLVLSRFMHKFHNINLYDYHSLEVILKDIGFVDVTRCEISCSKHKMLQNIERYISYIPSDINQFETIVMEVTKDK